ncbi:PIN domain-containing protein [Candidatus Magnetomoraceae bacterium gMMP-1]
MKGEYLDSICYLDTNIFVYMHDENEIEKREISNCLYKLFLQTGKGRIFVQVISEWRNTMIKKFSLVVSKEVRRNFIRLLEAWDPLVITPKLIFKADELCDCYNFSPMMQFMSNVH